MTTYTGPDGTVYPVTPVEIVAGDVGGGSGLPATAATLANVAGSASSVTLLAANADRQGATIVNDSTAALRIKFGAAASATSFSYYLPGSVGGAPSTLELAFRYVGIITGIWESATGTARVTEFV